ncbi:hypothetical protein B0H19DRAFT_972900, partial [Mycena capillaripes]
TANSPNPLDFNYTSNTNFLNSHVRCFRRERVRVERELFNTYQARGYFDEDHTIGSKHFFGGLKTCTPLQVSYREVNVIHDGKKRYHVIRAKTPPSWRQSHSHIPFVDVAKSGYQTTVGVASFREVLSNKIEINEALENLCAGPPQKSSL